MQRKQDKDRLRTLNIPGRAIATDVNPTKDKAVDEPRANRHPEFLQETMFEEHGTKVLITNPAADVYLDQHRDQQEKMKKLKEKYSNWIPPQDSY